MTCRPAGKWSCEQTAAVAYTSAATVRVTTRPAPSARVTQHRARFRADRLPPLRWPANTTLQLQTQTGCPHSGGLSTQHYSYRHRQAAPTQVACQHNTTATDTDRLPPLRWSVNTTQQLQLQTGCPHSGGLSTQHYSYSYRQAAPTQVARQHNTTATDTDRLPPLRWPANTTLQLQTQTGCPHSGGLPTQHYSYRHRQAAPTQVACQHNTTATATATDRLPPLRWPANTTLQLQTQTGCPHSGGLSTQHYSYSYRQAAPTKVARQHYSYSYRQAAPTQVARQHNTTATATDRLPPLR